MANFGETISGISNLGNMGDMTSMFGGLGGGHGDFTDVYSDENSTDLTAVLGNTFSMGDIGADSRIYSGSAYGFGKSRNEGFSANLGLGDDIDISRRSFGDRSKHDDFDGFGQREGTTKGTRVFRLAPKKETRVFKLSPKPEPYQNSYQS